MKINKKIPLIDQHNKNGFWGGKFGGNFIPETLKKPIEDLEILFSKLRNNKKFIFETLINVDKNKGKLKLYLDLTDDPVLKNVPPESLFSSD